MAAICMLVYRFVCVWDNEKRDQSGTVEAYEHAYEDDFTDKKVRLAQGRLLIRFADPAQNPQFRYIL